MYPINPATPRLFPQLTPRTLRLTADDFSTPRAQIPQTQPTLGSSERTPQPAREVLMAAALAYQGPVMAKSLIEEQKKKETADHPVDFSMAI